MTDLNNVDSASYPEGETIVFRERLSNIPAYVVSLSKLQSLYTSTKECNKYTKCLFNMSESFTGCVGNVMKLAVGTTTKGALKIAEPIIGEISNPMETIDSYASDMLGTVQERFPFVKQAPEQILSNAKLSVKDTKKYYLQKVYTSPVTQQAVRQVDNALSMSDFIVELCLPANGTETGDEKYFEMSDVEGNGVLTRAKAVKDKAYRRSTRLLISFTPVRITVDCIKASHRYISRKLNMFRASDISKDLSPDTGKVNGILTEINDSQYLVCDEIRGDSQFYSADKRTEKTYTIAQSWDSIFRTTTHTPQITTEVAGEVYVSHKGIVFTYSSTYDIAEIPQAVKNKAKYYYSILKEDMQEANTVKNLAIAFEHTPVKGVRNLQTIHDNNSKDACNIESV